MLSRPASSIPTTPAIHRWCRLLLCLLGFAPGLVIGVGLSTDSLDVPRASWVEVRDRLATRFSPGEFIDVDAAFQVQVWGEAGARAIAAFTIADGYYLYRDKFAFRVTDESIDHGTNEVLRENWLTPANLPDGTRKDDQYFGEVTILTHDFSLPLTIPTPTDPTAPRHLQIRYQGCAEAGICYAPVTRAYNLQPTRTASLYAITLIADPTIATAPTPTSAPTQSIQSTQPTRSLIIRLLAAIGAGLLLTFTPCVLPMLPVLLSIIAGRGAGSSRRRGGILAGSYVLGSMATYAVMGGLAGATGEQLQAYFQNVWAIGLLSALLFAMALSMFGLFTLQMPGFVQQKIHAHSTNLSDRQATTRSTLAAIPLVFVLGLISALILGACVSPVLIAFIGTAIANQDPVLGAQMMGALAFGMGLPLIAMGLGAGHLLPKAGAWLVACQHSIAWLLVAVAIYLLGQLAAVPILLLWGVFFIVLSRFIGGELATAPTARQKFVQGVRLVLVVYGALLILGGFSGQRDPLQPLPPQLFTNAARDHATRFVTIRDDAHLQQQLARARANGQPVLLDYYADWCVDCVRMARTTFAAPAVVAEMEAFVRLQIDVTDPTDSNTRQMKQRFAVFGPPATLFIDATGQLLTDYNFYGYRNTAQFLTILAAVAGRRADEKVQ